MHRRTSFLIALIAIVAIVTVDVTSVAGESEEIAVNVTSPAKKEGIEVRNSLLVKGTAELPPGYHIWVFARREDFDTDGIWWPQNEGRINSRTGEWRVSANFGGPQDVDWYFDVAVAVFDMDAHHELKEWLKDANERKSWEPIPMPEAAAPPQLFKVHKVDHN